MDTTHNTDTDTNTTCEHPAQFVDTHRTTSRTEAVIVDVVTALVVAVIVAAVALPIVWALVSAYRWVL